jgi:predicted nucleic acid-binding protein
VAYTRRHPGVRCSCQANYRLCCAAFIHLGALERYRKTKVHFVDCLLAATAAAEDTPVATFNQDFRKFADVRVETQ